MSEMSTGAFVLPSAVWLPAAKGAGLEIAGTFARRDGAMKMDLTFTNAESPVPISDVALQFNKNSFALTAAANAAIPTLQTGESAQGWCI